MFRIKIGSDLNDNSASSEQVYFVGSEEQLHKSIWDHYSEPNDLFQPFGTKFRICFPNGKVKLEYMILERISYNVHLQSGVCI